MTVSRVKTTGSEAITNLFFFFLPVWEWSPFCASVHLVEKYIGKDEASNHFHSVGSQVDGLFTDRQLISLLRCIFHWKLCCCYVTGPFEGREIFGKEGSKKVLFRSVAKVGNIKYNITQPSPTHCDGLVGLWSLKLLKVNCFPEKYLEMITHIVFNHEDF